MSVSNEDNIVLLDGLEPAFLGYGLQFGGVSSAVYDMEKCIEIIGEDMGPEDAREYFFYNVLGLGGSDGIMPVFLERKDD